MLSCSSCPDTDTWRVGYSGPSLWVGAVQSADYSWWHHKLRPSVCLLCKNIFTVPARVRFHITLNVSQLSLSRCRSWKLHKKMPRQRDRSYLRMLSLLNLINWRETRTRVVVRTPLIVSYMYTLSMEDLGSQLYNLCGGLGCFPRNKILLCSSVQFCAVAFAVTSFVGKV